MKPGSRLKSVVCDTEVIVVRGGGDAAPECGGKPMADERPADKLPIDPAFSGGTMMGKRYVDAAGTIELLCVKPGQGSLSLGGEALVLKEAKPLPSSD
jgi:hypothetical protein